MIDQQPKEDTKQSSRGQRRARRQRSQVPMVSSEQLQALNDALLSAEAPSRYGHTVMLVRGVKDSITAKRAEGMSWSQITSIINNYLGTKLKASAIQRAFLIVVKNNL